MTENEVAKEVVDAAYHVHKRLGPGLLESVYEVVLAHELTKRGLGVVRQQPISIKYESITFEEAFRADMIVEEKVILEIKSVETVSAVHKKQLLTYLRLAGKRLGLLINFGAELIKMDITRIVNGLPDEQWILTPQRRFIILVLRSALFFFAPLRLCERPSAPPIDFV